MADPFTVQLRDIAGVTAQAGESAHGWNGDRVELIRDDLSARVVSPDASGTATADPGDSKQATVTNVTRAGMHRSALIWRRVSGGGATITPGAPHTVVLSARLRLSIWAFTPPFTTPEGRGKLDKGLLELLQAACVDDLSLVTTIGWDRRGAKQTKANPPRWLNGSLPVGGARDREAYMNNLIEALHGMGIQVVPGFALVKKTGAGGDVKKDADDFAGWLAGASDDEIDDYAGSINHFFESRGLDVDGIGFDFEIDELTLAHAPKLALLYRRTSEAVAHHNGLVSYANAPFVKDGEHRYGFMKAQPFALAASAHNLLARPMCFAETTFSDVPTIARSVACALRPRNDPLQPGGAGLHPSQVQFAVWTSKTNVIRLCKEVLRPNRVGLMAYSMPTDRDQAVWFLTQCKRWNEVLNPDEGPQGQDGLPLQVPRGFGGWPPRLKKST